MQGITYCANRERNWSVQINFPGKPDQTMRDRMKKMGLTFAPSESAWIKRGSWVGSDITRFLEEIGAVKVSDIERENISFSERLEVKQEKAEVKAERLEERAEKTQAEADRRFATATKLADMVPMGQPILVGHYSEGRHRRHLAKIDTNMGRGCEAQKQAKELERRAAAAGVPLKGYDKPDFLARRIKECEAELRRLEKNKHHYASEMDNWQRYYDETKSKLDYCKQRLTDLGGVMYGPDNVHKGDVVLCGGLGLGYVKRANPTTITVVYLDPPIFNPRWPAKCEYGHIKECRTAEETITLMEKEATESGSRLAGVLQNLKQLTA